MLTQGPKIYFATGDLSTLEYLYSRRLARASSEMHSATAASVAMLVNQAISGAAAKKACGDACSHILLLMVMVVQLAEVRIPAGTENGSVLLQEEIRSGTSSWAVCIFKSGSHRHEERRCIGVKRCPHQLLVGCPSQGLATPGSSQRMYVVARQ